MAVEDVFGIVGSVQADAFRVEQAVAEGGFAVVYKAYHEAFDDFVALKCLKVPDALRRAEQEEFLNQFQAEAKNLFKLSARIPCVVRPLHAGVISSKTHPFVPYLALEWLDGMPLNKLTAKRILSGRRPLSVVEVIRLLKPAAEGLHQAHNFATDEGVLCVLHRDLKPENVYVINLGGVPEAKVLDFGIAKTKSAATAVAGKASQTVGAMAAFTPRYAAPEQWIPKRFGQTGPWTDVWGLAITMVETLTGEPPIRGDQTAMLGAVIDPQVRPTPRNHDAEVSDAVERVFTRALAVDPRQRYQSMQEFIGELERAAHEDGEVGVSAAAPAGAAPGARPSDRLGSAQNAPVQQGPEIPDLDLQLARPHPLIEGMPTIVASSPPDGAGSSRPKDLNAGVRAGRSIDPAPRPPPRGAQPSASGTPAARSSPRSPDGRAGLASPSSSGSARTDFDLGGPGATGLPDLVPLELDAVGGGSLAPRSGTLAQSLRVRSLRATTTRETKQAVSSLKLQLRLPLQLVAAGMLIGALGFLFTWLTDQAVPGPIRPLWLSGPLVLVGIGLGVYRLLTSGDA